MEDGVEWGAGVVKEVMGVMRLGVVNWPSHVCNIWNNADLVSLVGVE